MPQSLAHNGVMNFSTCVILLPVRCLHAAQHAARTGDPLHSACRAPEQARCGGLANLGRFKARDVQRGHAALLQALHHGLRVLSPPNAGTPQYMSRLPRCKPAGRGSVGSRDLWQAEAAGTGLDAAGCPCLLCRTAKVQ